MDHFHPNHKIYVKDENGPMVKLAKDLNIGDTLFVPDNPISQELVDFFIGSLLGDGSITNTSGLVFSYGHIKKGMIKDLSNVLDCKVEIRKRSGNKSEFYYIRKRHKINNYLRKLFYEDKKIIRDDLLSKINERVLAVWFMDDLGEEGTIVFLGSSLLAGFIQPAIERTSEAIITIETIRKTLMYRLYPTQSI